MRKFLIILMCIGLLAAGGTMAWAESESSSQQQQPQTYYGPGYGYGMGSGMMGPGYGYGMGPGMMGPGYGYGMGPGMMGPGYGYGMGGQGGYGMGPGMMGPGYGYGQGGQGGYGSGPGGAGWQSLSPKDRQAWQNMFREHQQNTLKLRQEYVTKRMELENLWAQPNPDQKRVRELSKQLSEIQAQLARERDEFLLQCRQKFGDKGWSCPGGGY